MSRGKHSQRASKRALIRGRQSVELYNSLSASSAQLGRLELKYAAHEKWKRETCWLASDLGILANVLDQSNKGTICD